MKPLMYWAAMALLPLAFSCNGGDKSSSQTQNNSAAGSMAQQRVQHFDLQITNTDVESIGRCGDKYNIVIKGDGRAKAQNVSLKVDGVEVASLNGDTVYTLSTDGLRCGILTIAAQVDGGQEPEYLSKSICLHSDIVPAKKTFKVLASYNHDVNAYTQGLVFDNGILYESTGLNGKSSLRKVNIDRGEVLQSTPLDQEFFGEGLALIDSKLMQLTWRSHKGFVYDKGTFQKIQEFYLSTEGWGLSAINRDSLVLTDGTENIYFMEPNMFSVVGQRQVYDNMGPLKMLNETEMYNGRMLANIYQSDMIAEIDYKTGKVLSYIDLSGILPDNMYTQDTDVLNGIAYDSQHDKLYITGKNWPKLYLIKIIDSK